MKSAADIVPAALLARPFRDEARRLERDLCADQLDPYLRRLASQEARCRRVLGTIAQQLLRRRAYHALGFARIGDYARERLGVSGRELQSTARVTGALATLPAIAAAFEEGALSWTQVRLLAPVAEPATERAWIALASARTVRALEALVRTAVATAREGGAGAAITAASATDGVEALECAGAAAPPSVVPLAVSPSALRAADAALDECAEDDGVVDGEPEVAFRLRCPRWVGALWRETVELARRMAGEPLAVWRAAEAIAAEGLSAAPHEHRATPPHEQSAAASPNETHAAGAALAGVETGTASDKPPEVDLNEARDGFASRSGLGPLDWLRIVEALPADVESLVRDVGSCDAHALDARLCTVAHAMQRVDWQMGRLLRLFLDSRLYAVLGFPTAERYVRERLGMSARKARLLVAVERKTWSAPALMAAYREGRLSCLHALTIAPVLSERTDEAWVARASEVTLRRLADEVGWALDVRDTSAALVAVAPPPAGATLTPPERQMRAPHDETLDTDIHFRGPASVVGLVRIAIAAFHAPLTPAWTGFVSLLDHAKAEWERQPHHRDPIFARDGWRCTVPACSSRRNFHDHHLRFRSRGGDNALPNRSSVCASHHLRGIHDGHVKVWGTAPSVVHWELGVRSDGPPLLRLVGDAYQMSGDASDAAGDPSEATVAQHLRRVS
ncbi:MAG: HNH endonuclease [Deltaproteobacteria bacterium]|nr:HNH endonuclease [Deltaproteobacteria bacterium]